MVGMKATATVDAPNSVLLIMDPNVGVAPEAFGNQRFSSTETCAAIGTLMEGDGNTTITLTTNALSVPTEPPRYRTTILVPGRVVAVCNVLRQSILKVSINAEVANLIIWANDPREPDQITVLVE